MPPEQLRRILERLNFLLGLKEERQGASPEAQRLAAQRRAALGIAEPEPSAQQAAATRRLFGRRYDPNNAQDLAMVERLVDEIVREVQARSQAQGIAPSPIGVAREIVSFALLDETRSLGSVLAHPDPATNVLNQVIADKERLELGPHPEVPIFGMKFNESLNAARDSGRITQLQFDFIKNPSRASAIPTARDAELGITISTLERDAIAFVEELKANMPDILSGAQTERGDFTTAVTRVFRAEPIEDIAQGRSLLPSFGQTDAQVRAEQQAGAFTELFERPNLKKGVDALIDANPELQLNPLTATKDERDADQRLRARVLQAAENLQGQNASATDIQAAISEMLAGADFVAARDTLIANAEQERVAAAAPTTTRDFEGLVTEALRREGVQKPSPESVFRLALRAEQAGVTSAEDIPRELVLQGIADFRLDSGQKARETAFGATRALTTSDRNLNAFVLGKLRGEGVFSRTSSPAFIQSIQQDILPGVAQEVAEILESQPFSDPDAAFATAFGSLSERRDADSTFGIGLSEQDFKRQRGIGGITLGARPAAPLFTTAEERRAFSAAAFGDDPNVRAFALSRRDELVEQFETERERRDRAFRGKQEAFSETVGAIRQASDVLIPFDAGIDPRKQRALDLVEAGAVPLSAFGPTRPEPQTFGGFVAGQRERLEAGFAATPQGIRLEESRRRRRLRGGRTVFTPTFGR